jgi:hypothetical protein
VYAINLKNKLFFSKPDGMPVVNAMPRAGGDSKTKTCVGCFIMSKFNKFLSKIQKNNNFVSKSSYKNKIII